MTDFHMLTLEQYLTEDIGVPIDEYTKKVLYATLQEIMQSRADYLHTCCLLYTSPSPRDLSTSRMPSSA